MNLTNFVGADVTRSGYIKELVYEYLTNQRKQKWLDVNDPLRLTFVLHEYLFRVTFTFEREYDFMQFMYDVSMVRGGNPFVLRFERTPDYNEWLAHAFHRMGVKANLKHFPYHVVYAEQHIQELINS